MFEERDFSFFLSGASVAPRLPIRLHAPGSTFGGRLVSNISAAAGRSSPQNRKMLRQRPGVCSSHLKQKDPEVRENTRQVVSRRESQLINTTLIQDQVSGRPDRQPQRVCVWLRQFRPPHDIMLLLVLFLTRVLKTHSWTLYCLASALQRRFRLFLSERVSQ